MDWSKAKTILIIALIITNLILGYVIMSNYEKEDLMFSDEFIEEVKDMLLEKDIRLNTSIPKNEPSLVPLIVEYETIDPDKINRLYFENKASVTIDKNKSIIKKGKEEVILINNKNFKYRNLSEDNIYKDLDKEEAIKIAEDYIGKLKFNRQDMSLNYITEKDGIFRLIYSKKYEDIYLENAYIDIKIDKTGIKSVNRIWLDVKDKGDKDIYISKAPKAILSLLSKKEAYGRTIEEIAICNYFDPIEHEYIETPEDASRGKTIPAWRVLLDDGNRIIIDDY